MPAESTPTAAEQARLLTGLVDSANGHPDQASLLDKVCRAAALELTMLGCAVHLVAADGASGLAAVSGPDAAAVADLAFAVGEGPTLDAFALRRPVLVPDLSFASARWPGYVEATTAAGVAAVFCFPLRVGGVTLGVFDLYDGQDRPLVARRADLALAFTDLATEIVLDGRPVDVHGRWEAVMDHRAEIHQAQGMVMVDLGVDLAEALARMRAHAFSEGLPLIELAAAIIGGLTLPPTTGAEP